MIPPNTSQTTLQFRFNLARHPPPTHAALGAAALGERWKCACFQRPVVLSNAHARVSATTVAPLAEVRRISRSYAITAAVGDSSVTWALAISEVEGEEAPEARAAAASSNLYLWNGSPTTRS
jgi:hypothetical protein